MGWISPENVLIYAKGKEHEVLARVGYKIILIHTTSALSWMT